MENVVPIRKTYEYEGLARRDALQVVAKDLDRLSVIAGSRVSSDLKMIAQYLERISG